MGFVGAFRRSELASLERPPRGVALQDASLDELMTGREHLVLAARLTGARMPAARALAGELLEVFGLVAAADRIAVTPR